MDSKEFQRSVRCDCNHPQSKIAGIFLSIFILRRAYYPMIFFIKRSTQLFNKLLLLIQINIQGILLFICLFFLDSIPNEQEAVYQVLKALFVNELDIVMGILFVQYLETYYPEYAYSSTFMMFKRTQREAEITFIWCSVNLVTFVSIQLIKYFKFKNFECPDFDAYHADFDKYRKSFEGYSVLNFFLMTLTYFSYFWNFV